MKFLLRVSISRKHWYKFLQFLVGLLQRPYIQHTTTTTTTLKRNFRAQFLIKKLLLYMYKKRLQVSRFLSSCIKVIKYSISPMQIRLCRIATALNYPLLSQSNLQLTRNRGLEQFRVASLPDTNDVNLSSNNRSAMLKYRHLFKELCL